MVDHSTDQILLRSVSPIEMPRYYFHVKRGQVTILDQLGVELADIDEAANEAARRGQAIAARMTLTGNPPTDGTIVIEEGWRTVLELPFDRH